jgi:uncharacterized heparinase superfamily protein
MSQREIGEAVAKLKRLGSMTSRELVHRVREKGYSGWERIARGVHDPEAPQGWGFKSYLAGAPSRRFYGGRRRQTHAFIDKKAPRWIERMVDEAEKLCEHRVELLNLGPTALVSKIDWHRDPFTGQTWEQRFWSDYHPERDPHERDVKNIHELNRHQHLPRLAKAYHWTGNESYAAEAVAQMESWIEQNPLRRGINWQSSLEIAIRAISWLWTMFFLIPSESFDEISARRIGDSLFAQLEHIRRHTSLYSSPNTHLIGEATALFVGGLIFRDQACGARWLDEGARLLWKEADKQILPDGVYAELSSYYHCYALDFYLQALILADWNQFPVPAQVRQKVCDMLRFLMHVTRPDGTLALLGDDDGGRALALQQRTYRSFNDALSAGAVMFHRPDFKYQAGAFSEENYWLLGKEAWDAYDALESTPPAETQLFCPDAGYNIQRSGWGTLDSHLIFDFGGLGMLTGGHAHADALSIGLFSHGRELLVDPGTFAYNGKTEWRGYFRSTRAHNTVTIDGRDQAEGAGTFRWRSKISSTCRLDHEPQASAIPIEYLEAEHDGYSRLPEQIVHRRRLIHVPGEYWILADDFRGSGQHTFDFNFHLGKHLTASTLEHDDGATVMWSQEGLLVALFASEPSTADLIQGQTEPIEGWVSHGYGALEPSAALRVRMTGPASTASITLVAPVMKAPVVARLKVDSGAAIACSYEHQGFTDIAVLSSGESDVHVAGFEMRGEFFWLRMERGLLRQTFAIRGGRLRAGPARLEGALCAASAAS